MKVKMIFGAMRIEALFFVGVSRSFLLFFVGFAVKTRPEQREEALQLFFFPDCFCWLYY